jgi:hypothetical protein
VDADEFADRLEIGFVAGKRVEAEPLVPFGDDLCRASAGIRLKSPSWF